VQSHCQLRLHILQSIPYMNTKQGIKNVKVFKKPISVVRLRMLLKGQNWDTFTFVRNPLVAETFNNILTLLFPTNFTISLLLIQVSSANHSHLQGATSAAPYALSNIQRKSYVYWTVHHSDSWVKRDQLDATCFIIILSSAQHVSDVNTSILGSRLQPAYGYHTTIATLQRNTNTLRTRYNPWSNSTN